GAPTAAVAVDARRGHAFVSSVWGGTVGMLDAQSGALRHINSLDQAFGPRSMAVDEQTARLFVPNGDNGSVSLLDTRHGTLLRTVSVGGFPQQVAVDAPPVRTTLCTGCARGRACARPRASSGTGSAASAP